MGLTTSNEIYFTITNEPMRYFRVIKENPLWEMDAIIQTDGQGYKTVGDMTVFNIHGATNTEYLSEKIVEESPAFFQEVFPYGSARDKMVYMTKDLFKKAVKENNEFKA